MKLTWSFVQLKGIFLLTSGTDHDGWGVLQPDRSYLCSHTVMRRSTTTQERIMIEKSKQHTQLLKPTTKTTKEKQEKRK